MNVQEFVRESLVQICNGIADANRSGRLPNGASVNPLLYGGVHKEPNECQAVEFDIAVFASDKKTTNGEVGIALAVVGLEAKGQSDHATGSESRLQFKVPVWYPLGAAPNRRVKASHPEGTK